MSKSFRLEHEEADRLEAEAIRQKTDESTIIRHALKTYLDEMEALGR